MLHADYKKLSCLMLTICDTEHVRYEEERQDKRCSQEEGDFCPMSFACEIDSFEELVLNRRGVYEPAKKIAANHEGDDHGDVLKDKVEQEHHSKALYCNVNSRSYYRSQRGERLRKIQRTRGASRGR